MSTILTTRNPNQEDLRVGVVKNFFIHTPQIRMDAASAADSITLELYQLPHAFANVYWYQDHPMKLCRFKNGIVMAATLFDSPSSATFIPVSRSCRVEHQHQLAHQYSPNIIGIWEWGICGLMGGAFIAYWVGHL